jgi:serine/threonine/tyrosine-interacting protein
MYVMQYYNITSEEGVHLVQQRRYCISPNSGFIQQIKVHTLC